MTISILQSHGVLRSTTIITGAGIPVGIGIHGMILIGHGAGVQAGLGVRHGHGVGVPVGDRHGAGVLTGVGAGVRHTDVRTIPVIRAFMATVPATIWQVARQTLPVIVRV